MEYKIDFYTCKIYQIKGFSDWYYIDVNGIKAAAIYKNSIFLKDYIENLNFPLLSILKTAVKILISKGVLKNDKFYIQGKKI